MKYVIGFSIAFLCASLAVAFVGAPPKSSADWAAWVQAGGSIMVIGTSVALVAWQSHRERERARSDARAQAFRHLDAAFEIVGGTAHVVRKIADEDFAHNAITFNTLRGELGALAGALGAIDVTNLGGHKVTESILVSLGAAPSTGRL